jgi:hypothetical protein
MSKVTIEHERTNLYVEIQVDTSTYLLSQEQYAELFHTVLQHPPKDVLWLSCVTKDMIDPSHAEQAIDEMNDYVANTCMEYALEDEEDNE